MRFLEGVAGVDRTWGFDRALVGGEGNCAVKTGLSWQFINVLMKMNYHENYGALVVETIVGATPVALAEVGDSQT